jgi:hypothetical protein
MPATERHTHFLAAARSRLAPVVPCSGVDQSMAVRPIETEQPNTLSNGDFVGGSVADFIAFQ